MYLCGYFMKLTKQDILLARYELELYYEIRKTFTFSRQSKSITILDIMNARTYFFIDSYIMKLSIEDRTFLVDYYVLTYKQNEIELIFGVSINAFYSRRETIIRRYAVIRKTK